MRKLSTRHCRKRQLRLENLEARVVLTGDIVISEVMASNDTILSDVHDQYTDWFEVFNNGTESVSLDGWHATDDDASLTKWQFPDVTLEPNEYLVVFASDKNRTDPGGELHTNFRLTTDGEYLAIVEPDGVTVSHEYNPYEEQFVDISYGPEQTTLVYDFVSAGADASVLLPNSSEQDIPATTWTAAEFDDGGWLDRNLGVGFDQNDHYDAVINTNGDVADMLGNTATAYVRTSFTIDGDVPPLDELDLTVNYDDGFVAYLNGTEIASDNAPASRAWDSVATQDHGGIIELHDIDDFSSVALQETFTLNGDASFSENGRLQLTRDTYNLAGTAWLTEPLAFGAEYSFSSSFSVDVHSPKNLFLERPDADGEGGHGMTFVLQSGGEFRLGGNKDQLGLDSSGMTFVAVELDSFESGSFDPDTSLPSHVGIDTSVDGNVTRVAVPRFNDTDGPRYVWVDYDGFTDQFDVYFSETNSKPASPTVSATVDLETLFGGVPTLWAGFTAATSWNANAHDVLDWEISTFSNELGLFAKTIDVRQHIDLLQSGENVLSIHGLNVDASDADFFVDASLVGGERNVTFLDSVKYYVAPTPGEPNGSGTDAPSGPVEFSAAGRTFVDPFMLALSTESPAGTIRYTTDGSMPNEASEVYTEPIEISETSRIRARAFEEGRAPGIVSSEGYLQIDSSLTEFEGGVFESNLPLMIFDSFGSSSVNSSDYNLVPVSAVIIDVGDDGRANILDEPDLAGQAGMRIRGQSSQGWPKKMYALEFWEETIDYTDSRPAAEAPDRDVSFLGLPAESDWVLNGPYSDKTQLNNYLAFNLHRQVGLEAPRTRLVEVFVNANGGAVGYGTDYRGTYVLMEKNKIGANRVDLDDAIPDPAPGADPTTVGGYMFKQDKDGRNDVNFQANSGGPNITLKFVEPGAPNAAQQAWLSGFVNEFETVLYGDDFADPEIGYAKYIDVDSFVDHWLITELAKEIDGYRLSEYFFLNLDGKIEKGPAWDFNLSFSNANYLDGGIWDGFYADLVGGAQYHWYPRLFQDPNFESKLHDRWFELRQTTYSWEHLEGMIDEAVAALTNGSPNFDTPAPGEPSNPISRNFDRYGTIDTYLWPNCFFQGGTCRPSPLPPEMSLTGRPNSYDDYIFIMKDFVENRLTWIDQEFGLPPAISPEGGIVPDGTQVSITSTEEGTIYYTTDGTDPRQTETLVQEETILAPGGEVQYVVPENGDMIDACSGGISLRDASACFVNPEYVLGTHGETWTPGQLGVGFDTDANGEFDPLIATDIEGDLHGANSSVYLRIPFEVTADQKALASGINLNVRYDDGFAAYLWFGSLRTPTEAVRSNAPGVFRRFPINSLAFNASATEAHDDAEAVQFEQFDITTSRTYLVPGTNYLIVQVLNEGAADSDLLFDVEITYTYETILVPDSVQEYSGPITIDDNTQVIARTYDVFEDKWSSRASESYFVSIPPVVITELNYNPSPLTQADEDAGFFDDDEFEFIEIMNVGSEPVSLDGFRLDEAVQLTFGDESLASGERAVVVRNQAAFEHRYGAVHRVLGQYGDPLDLRRDFRLANEGERVVMLGPLGEPVMDFTYDDDWHPLTDGEGFSLVIRDPNAERSTWGDAAAWRPSDLSNGSPGNNDFGIAPLPGSIVVSELLSDPATGSDVVELRNVTDADVEIGSFYLTDTEDNLRKYRLPVNTTVPADGYLLLDQSVMGAGFDVSKYGGTLILQAANPAGAFTGFRASQGFGASDPDVSHGRYENSVGNVDFVALADATLPGPNAEPLIGPVVISEIMYNPALGGTDFVELHNRTQIDVSLEDGQGSPWVLAGGIDFSFPAGATISAGGYAVVIEGADFGDPGQDAADFRVAHGVPDNVPIFVYTPTANGVLDNSDDRIIVARPSSTDQPPITVDMVRYDDEAPWPTEPDGQGPSLIRLATSNYGNDPANWGIGDDGGSPGQANSTSSGDLNLDGLFTIADIDLLYAGLADNSTDPALDIDGNGTLNFADVEQWLNIAGNANVGSPYTQGDANLDGRVNSMDLNTLGTNWRITTATSWGQADFNADGTVNALDLNDIGFNWLNGVVVAAPAQGTARLPRAPLSGSSHVLADYAVNEGQVRNGVSSPAKSDRSENDFPAGEATDIGRKMGRAVLRSNHPYGIAHGERSESINNRSDDGFAELVDEAVIEWEVRR